MGLLKSSIHFAPLSTSFIPVSLFDLESRFFAPTTRVEATRTGLSRSAVALPLAARSLVPRPRLGWPEHGGHAGRRRDDDQKGELCHRARIIAPQPCIR
jgi:hypothetical protein